MGADFLERAVGEPGVVSLSPVEVMAVFTPTTFRRPRPRLA
jgi:hypothetical protein